MLPWSNVPASCSTRTTLRLFSTTLRLFREQLDDVGNAYQARRNPVVAVAVTLVLSACANPPDQASDPSSRSATATTTAVAEESWAAPGFVEVVERVSPSVVTVLTDGGQGSGVVLRPDVVVTNAHVVGQQRKVSIVLADRTQSPVEVLGTDEVTDVAVVRTERGDLPVTELREDLPRPGERVLAIGRPLGFQNSVSAGIISGLHRDVPGSAAQTYSPVDLIQTDASISPGNSGGALLDTQGRVVGINEAYIPPAAGAVSIVVRDTHHRHRAGRGRATAGRWHGHPSLLGCFRGTADRPDADSDSTSRSTGVRSHSWSTRAHRRPARVSSRAMSS
jgi:S1-C subfamily serine protease